MRLLLGAAMLLLQIAVTNAATLDNLPQPKGEVILTIEGQIGIANSGLEAQFDMAMLEALPKTEVKTQNPWEAGVVSYEGVLLRDLLTAVAANGTVLTIQALNDYRADLNVSDTASIDVILAYKRDGEFMPVRQKGPLFVVFPFTAKPALAIEERYGQSVWQVTRITVK